MEADPNGLTIDELARRTRTTTRTLRLYQTKSLLPPPRIVGRVGYYTEMHVNRLLMIERLQMRGFSLAGIAELFKIWQAGKGLDELFGFEARIVKPWNEEEPEFLTREEFEEQLPDLFHNRELLEHATKLNVVEPLEDGGLKVMSPILLNFGRELVSKGVPSELNLKELERLRDDSRRIAARLLALFGTYILPNMVHGGPMEWLPRLADYTTVLRPAVRAMMLSVFMRAMDEEMSSMAAAHTQPPDDDAAGDEEAGSAEPPLDVTAEGRR